MLEYIHAGYASVFEKDLILKFRKGKLVNEKEIDNREKFRKELIKREMKEKKDEGMMRKTFWEKLFGK